MTCETWLDRMIAEQQALRRVNGKPVELLKFIPAPAHRAPPRDREAGCASDPLVAQPVVPSQVIA